jgi:hypothetical protein
MLSQLHATSIIDSDKHQTSMEALSLHACDSALNIHAKLK